MIGYWTTLMDRHALRVFRAVVDERGFARAADAVRLTQPAVSQIVARLEADVGTRLLTRERPPVPTPAGLRLYRHAVDVLTREEAARRDIDDIRKGGAGVLMLGASQALARHALPHLVRAFLERWPLASLHLETLPSRELIRVVTDGRLELGLGPFQTTMPGFVTHPLGTQRMVLYAGRGSTALAALRREGEEALGRLRLVTSYLDAPRARPGGGRLRERFRTVWEVHSLDLRIWMVMSGLAVGYLPEDAVRLAGLARRLVAVDWLEFGVIRRRVGLFHLDRRRLGDAAREFVAVAGRVPWPTPDRRPSGGPAPRRGR
jgi:DNA-binding transcriptional LysR family regulator